MHEPRAGRANLKDVMSVTNNDHRQSGAPIMVTNEGALVLRRVDRDLGGTYDEAFIQNLVYRHPETLPVDELDSTFSGLVPLCRELGTGAGHLDVAFINEQGLLILVECKLWRNPQARREVVGQILDYAKELSRWRYEDLEREVSRRLEAKGNVLFDLVRKAGATIEEDDFVDAVSRNLRQGRFLLLVVGDGIREGVEAIGEYLSGQAGLHFVFGLVEMPVYELPSGERLVHPRVLARTAIVERTVVELRGGGLEVAPSGGGVDADPAAADPSRDFYLSFWRDFLGMLEFDAKDQPMPDARADANLWFSLPVGNGWNIWLTAFARLSDQRVGVYLSCQRATVGEEIQNRLLEERATLELNLDREAAWRDDGRRSPCSSRHFEALDDPAQRQEALEWLCVRVNRYINVFRPRLQAIAEDMGLS